MEEKTGNKLPERKKMRLKQYDYSSAGAYFVTICIQDRKSILSNIIPPVGDGAYDVPQYPVGDGAYDVPQYPVGDGAYDVPQVRLTPIGKIIEKHLLSSENISGVKIDRYVIMPDHIHAIIFLDPNQYKHNSNKSGSSSINGTSRAPSPTNGTSRAPSPTNGTSRAPSPTNEMLPHIVSTFKRFCNRELEDNIFQRGYMEHIIRDLKDYETRANYIYNNPIRWYYKKINVEDD